MAGHLHAPQSAGSDRARYAGSPLKYSLSERGQHKSVTLLEIEKKGEVRISEVVFEPLRDVRLIEGPLDALLDARNQRDASTEDYVYANITGDDAVLYAMQKLRGVFPHILGLSFVSPMDGCAGGGRAAEVAGRDVADLFGAFYAHVTGSGLSASRAEIVRALARETQEAAR